MISNTIEMNLLCIAIHSLKNVFISHVIFKASAIWADAFYKSICPSVCLCVCVFTFEVPFKRLFAPTSRSRMSNIFTASESLGKSNVKKWSQIWTFLFENCWKSCHKKKFFFSTFSLFFDLLRFSVFFNSLFAPTSQNWMSNIFTDLDSLGKSNGKKWSQIWTFLFENCRKSRHKKKFFSSLFSIFFGFWSFLTVFLPPFPEVEYPIFLEIRNPWGKVMERSGLRYEHLCLKIV